MNKTKAEKAAEDTWKAIKSSLPVFIGVLLLIALITEMVPPEFYKSVFTGNNIMDSLIGAVLGGIMAGNPMNSYVLGGELLNQGVSLIAVTAFILSWVTVGVVQLPAESIMLGRKFAITRNLLSFFSAIIIAVLTSYTISFFK